MGAGGGEAGNGGVTRISEVELDHAFAETVEHDKAFRSFILRGGRFERHAENARLLIEEQAAARKAKHWWKHWWCKLPDRSEWETDIFLVFEAGSERFALHIEDKPVDGTLRLEQAAAYRRRAAFKANDKRWLGYTDLETILMAPAAFIANNGESTAQFDRTLSYEAVSTYVALFGAALR